MPPNVDDDGSQYSIEQSTRTYHVNFEYRDIDSLGPSVPREVRVLLRELDPCEGRCLITNATQESGIKLTHCMPLRLLRNHKWMGRLEWYWGLRFGDLDNYLQSPCNVFPVSVTLSAIYDIPRKKPSWILVPEDHIVDKFFNGLIKLDHEDKPCDAVNARVTMASRGSLPRFEEKTFKYRFVPMLHRMQSVVLTRQPDLQCTAPNRSEVSIHLHPFEDLPWVTSHIDPKLVIMETGRKLSLIPGIILCEDEWFTSRPVLRKIIDIFVSWKSPIPFSAFTHCPDYYTPDLDCPDETVQAITNSHGWRPRFSPSLRRKRSEELMKLAAERNFGGHPIRLPKLPLPKDSDAWATSKISTWSRDVDTSTELLDTKTTQASLGGVERSNSSKKHAGDDSEGDAVDAQTGGSRTPPRRLIWDGQDWY